VPFARVRDYWLLALAAEAVLLVVALTASGVWSGEVTPDTDTYFLWRKHDDLWGTYRHPGYGWFASWFGASADAAGWIAFPQALLHVAAPFVLYLGARHAGIGPMGAFSLSSAAMLSQANFLAVGQVMPESPAVSLMLMAFGGALAATASARMFAIMALPVLLLAGAAYILRPSFLPAIAVIPALYGLLAWRNGTVNYWRAPLLALLVALPFLVQSAVRLVAVGHFNIVSFGGYQMSPVAAFMLTPDIVGRLPERMRPTATALIEIREMKKREGVIPTTPVDRLGDRFYVTTALGYLDIYARSYDTVLHLGIADLQGLDESFVEFDKRLLQLSLATIAAAPSRWAIWVAGATARLIGRAIVLNAPMLAAIMLLCALAVPAYVGRWTLVGGADVAAVSIVALAWFVVAGLLAVLVTFPSARYIDSAAVLLPAIPLVFALGLFRGRRARQA
jgi:hypothetical protein